MITSFRFRSFNFQSSFFLIRRLLLLCNFFCGYKFCHRWTTTYLLWTIHIIRIELLYLHLVWFGFIAKSRKEISSSWTFNMFKLELGIIFIHWWSECKKLIFLGHWSLCCCLCRIEFWAKCLATHMFVASLTFLKYLVQITFLLSLTFRFLICWLIGQKIKLISILNTTFWIFIYFY
jgi:hypothetical protein